MFHQSGNNTVSLVSTISKSALLHLDGPVFKVHARLAVQHMFMYMSLPYFQHLPTLRELKKIKATKITELKESLSTGKKVETETKYFVLLSTEKAHNNYLVLLDSPREFIPK